MRNAMCAPSMGLPDWALTWPTQARCTDRHARHRSAAALVDVLASGVVGIVPGACGRLRRGRDRTRNEAVGTALVEKQAAEEVGRKSVGATWRAGTEVGEAEVASGVAASVLVKALIWPSCTDGWTVWPPSAVAYLSDMRLSVM